jgi:hypothetical protein
MSVPPWIEESHARLNSEDTYLDDGMGRASVPGLLSFSLVLLLLVHASIDSFCERSPSFVFY